MAAPKKKAAKKKTTAVAKTGTTAMANFDYGDAEGAGYEGQSADDLLIPFLNLLQKGSPLVEERDDAKSGMIYNTVTEEVYDEINFVPAITRHECVEWVPREKGGGFAGKHPMDSQVVREAQSRAESFNELFTADGNELSETFTVFGILCRGDEPVGMAVIPFGSTKIKVYKKYMSRLRMFTPKRADGTKFNPPLFAHLAVLGSCDQENPNGKFKNFTLEAAVNNKLPDSMMSQDDPRFIAAKEVYELVKSGVADANYDKMKDQANEGDGEELPF
ncbi:MAG: hypothetical protein DRQ48_00215 [Gammaproteobacteria bacterium]|nr:MAG: hypothetical protein DRQ48_00215 [Gammaproteobacteria bacterium]